MGMASSDGTDDGMTRQLFILLLTVTVLGTLPMQAVADDLDSLVLVAHPDIPVDQLSMRELKRIYLGKSTRWTGGQTIRPVMLQDGDAFETFVTEALDRTEENFSVYWKRMVFTGKGRPPRTFDDAESLAFYLTITEGAIGYLPEGTNRTGLKVITLH